MLMKVSVKPEAAAGPGADGQKEARLTDHKQCSCRVDWKYPEEVKCPVCPSAVAESETTEQDADARKAKQVPNVMIEQGPGCHLPAWDCHTLCAWHRSSKTRHTKPRAYCQTSQKKTHIDLSVKV